jgi:hypothetical protein
VPDWKTNPVLVRQLLEHEARQNPALRRRMAILEVLARRGFSPRDTLIREVEAQLTPGVFGAAPHPRLWSDLRALREAGIAIGYSRALGTEGYFLRLESLSEEIQTVIRQVMREIDFDHLDRVAKASPARRVEAVFEMIDFAHEVAQAGQQHRERRQ